MSRRMDREGINRMEPQGILNRRHWDDPRCVEDAKGWVQPFSNWQGWEEFNTAAYALYCLLIWRSIDRRSMGQVMREDGTIDRDELHRGSAGARMENHLHSFQWHLARSRECDRPALP